MLRTGHVVLAAGCLAAALTAPASAQGDNGFLRGKGKTDFALTYSVDTYNHFWVGSTKVKDPNVGRITREAANVYVAHGIDDQNDVFLSASYVDVESSGIANPGNSDEHQLQDAIVGLKHMLGERRVGPGSISLLFAPSVKVPMTHYEANAITAIGDGQIDYRARAIAQYRLDNGIYVAAESGFDYRTEGPPNEIPFNLSVGFTLFNRVTIAPFYSYVDSRGSKDIGTTSFPKVEEDYERWGISAYARLTEQVGVTAGWKDTLDGKNTGDLTGYWIGLVFKL